MKYQLIYLFFFLFCLVFFNDFLNINNIEKLKCLLRENNFQIKHFFKRVKSN